MWPAHAMALATVLCALLLSAAPTAAQEPSADASEDTIEINARRLFSAGAAAYEEHRYADALAYFEQTYALTPLPRLLYNIGLSAEHLGDRARAVSALEQYLAVLPDAENRVEVEGRLAILRSGGSSPDEDTATPAVPDELSGSTPPPSSAGASSSDGWVVLGISIGVFVVAAGIAAVGANDYATVSGLADGAPWASVRDASDRALPLLGVGIGAAALGLVGGIIGVVLLGSRHDEASAPTAALRVTPSGLLVEGSF